LELKVGDKQMTAENYIEDFRWDNVRYHSRKAINQIADGILKDVTKADEELKAMTAEFNEIKSNVTAYERKETGSLLVKPLGPYVKESDIVETEHITTLMVVVPKVKEQEFLGSYELLEDQAAEKELERQKERDARKREREAKLAEKEKLGEKKEEKHHDLLDDDEREEKREQKEQQDKRSGIPDCRNVVPRSAKRLYDPSKGQKSDDEDEFVLYRLLVMKKGADSYKNLCRDRRFTVRPFKYDPAEDQSQKDKKKQLDKQKAKLWAHIMRWAKTTYSDVFASWIHIKTMRLFVESVLRYGLPVDFAATLIKPKKGQEKRLRVLLAELYQKLSGEAVQTSDQTDTNEADLSGFGSEFYPYVYLPITLLDAVG